MAKPIKLNADAVVVGTGPGGATVARDLTKAGKKVIILELGKDNKPGQGVRSFVNFTGGPVGSLGKGVMFSNELLMMIRGVTLGGSSMVYTASAWDPPFDAFKKFGVEMDPQDTEDIKKELHVGPLPDSYIGPAASIIMKSAQDLGFDWQKVNKLVDTSKAQPNMRDFFCGSKDGIKWEARTWVLDAVKEGATLFTETMCDEVIVENGTATGVRAIGKGGKEYEISANVVVVSAGGVGSPMILQKSGIMDAGNKFFFDPFILTYGYFDKKCITPTNEIPMVAGTHLHDGIMLTDMRNIWPMYHFYLWTGVKQNKALASNKMASIMTKISDTLDGSVSVDGKIAKGLTEQDRAKLNKGKVLSRKILQNAGAKDIWYTTTAAAHPGGTCRIGKIVDENLETEYKGLYVSDASVIPDQFGLPPVLTILSLSRRLSKRLAPMI